MTGGHLGKSKMAFPSAAKKRTLSCRHREDLGKRRPGQSHYLVWRGGEMVNYVVLEGGGVIFGAGEGGPKGCST